MKDHLNHKFEKLALEDELALEKCSPFTRRVQEAPLPRTFKMPNLASYDETTDPIVHLTNYNTAMKIVGVETDEVKCLAFPMTLSGRAMTWFTQLRPKSIGSFKELAFGFTSGFISSRNRKTNLTALFQMNQGDSESLRKFVQRFLLTMNEIPDVNISMVVIALIQGTKDISLR